MIDIFFEDELPPPKPDYVNKPEYPFGWGLNGMPDNIGIERQNEISKMKDIEAWLESLTLGDDTYPDPVVEDDDNL